MSTGRTRRRRVMVIYGTRPEAVKMAPVVRALLASPVLEPFTVVTAQHREMLDQVNTVFGIRPDTDLGVFEAGQPLNDLVAKVLRRLDPLLLESAPDVVLVQGDTSTVVAAALAAFHRRVPVAHLEAGLRSGDLASPFPEEGNRLVASRLASLHLAPTGRARANLLAENVPAHQIVVSGNTVIDALLQAVPEPAPLTDPRLATAVEEGRPLVLVTAHRRESWGPAMAGVARALRRVCEALPDHVLILPVHPNPVVRASLLPELVGLDNVVVTEPLPYGEFVRVLGAAQVVLTDSGGVQEEAPSLGKPVLLMRENTERPEAVDAGTVTLVGTDEDRIVREVVALATDPVLRLRRSRATNPYGDGRAAERVVAALAELVGVGRRLPDFVHGVDTAAR